MKSGSVSATPDTERSDNCFFCCLDHKVTCLSVGELEFSPSPSPSPFYYSSRWSFNRLHLSCNLFAYVIYNIYSHWKWWEQSPISTYQGGPCSGGWCYQWCQWGVTTGVLAGGTTSPVLCFGVYGTQVFLQGDTKYTHNRGKLFILLSK